MNTVRELCFLPDINIDGMSINQTLRNERCGRSITVLVYVFYFAFGAYDVVLLKILNPLMKYFVPRHDMDEPMTFR